MACKSNTGSTSIQERRIPLVPQMCMPMRTWRFFFYYYAIASSLAARLVGSMPRRLHVCTNPHFFSRLIRKYESSSDKSSLRAGNDNTGGSEAMLHRKNTRVIDRCMDVCVYVGVKDVSLRSDRRNLRIKCGSRRTVTVIVYRRFNPVLGG